MEACSPEQTATAGTPLTWPRQEELPPRRSSGPAMARTGKARTRAGRAALQTHPQTTVAGAEARAVPPRPQRAAKPAANRAKAKGRKAKAVPKLVVRRRRKESVACSLLSLRAGRAARSSSRLNRGALLL